MLSIWQVFAHNSIYLPNSILILTDLQNRRTKISMDALQEKSRGFWYVYFQGAQRVGKSV